MNKYQIKVTSGSFAGDRFPLRGRVRVGSADDCDIVLEAEGIVAHHACLISDETQITIEALDGEVVVNGEVVRNRGLSSGDEIRLANVRLLVQAPGLKPQRVLEPEALQKKSRIGLYLALLIAALAGAGLAAWQKGLLPF